VSIGLEVWRIVLLTEDTAAGGHCYGWTLLREDTAAGGNCNGMSTRLWEDAADGGRCTQKKVGAGRKELQQACNVLGSVSVCERVCGPNRGYLN